MNLLKKLILMSKKFIFLGIREFFDLFSVNLVPLEKFDLPPNLGDLFSITTVFFD